MRIQNDGAGKSSWWMINPEVKTGTGKEFSPFALRLIINFFF